jgi:hypothetical protein
LGHAAAQNESDRAAADETILKSAGVGLDNDSLLRLFRQRTMGEADRERIKTMIGQLGDDSFEVREKASSGLVAVGTAAEPMLREAAKSTDVEVARRAEDCLRIIKHGTGAVLPMAVARMVARRKPAGAAEVLLAYLPFADNEAVADEVRTALAAAAVREGKVDPVLIAALGDKDPLRRGAAAEALARGGAREELAAVSRLLDDMDAGVRLRAALALASAGQRAAIPVLIDLMGQLKPDQAWLAEDVLLRLAGDHAPLAGLGTDEGSRRQCRQAWQEWWQTHQHQVDLAQLAGPPPVLGYTLVLLLDTGQAMEVDAKGRKRWQIEGLQFPLDVQYVTGNRILVAEHGGNRVTERNLKGDIVWERKADQPLMAQRLPSGNTFITTKNQFIEADASGKEVYSFSPATGEDIMRATKLRNGEIACVMFPGRFVRLDANGKELQQFPVDVRTSGGRIDVLPNGHVLVPEKDRNRVAEYDGEGKIVWETEVDQPIAAVHMANSNILVTTMNDNHAVELDRAGKVVWEYKANTRVNRAFRR